MMDLIKEEMQLLRIGYFEQENKVDFGTTRFCIFSNKICDKRTIENTILSTHITDKVNISISE